MASKCQNSLYECFYRLLGMHSLKLDVINVENNLFLRFTIEYRRKSIEPLILLVPSDCDSQIKYVPRPTDLNHCPAAPHPTVF